MFRPTSADLSRRPRLLVLKEHHPAVCVREERVSGVCCDETPVRTIARLICTGTRTSTRAGTRIRCSPRLRGLIVLLAGSGAGSGERKRRGRTNWSRGTCSRVGLSRRACTSDQR
jgi:hypothetical protein